MTYAPADAASNPTCVLQNIFLDRKGSAIGYVGDVQFHFVMVEGDSILMSSFWCFPPSAFNHTSFLLSQGDTVVQKTAGE